MMIEDTYYIRSIAKREKRKKQVRKNILLLLVFTVVISAFVALLASMSIQASDNTYQTTYKYYKSIMLSQGDTLWSIAEENMDKQHYNNTHDYIKEVKRMNSLTSDQIVCGSYLIIPYFSTEYRAETK